MMKKSNFFSRMLGSFSSEESGSISVETLLMFPMLIWSVAATFVYFDGFHARASSTKSAYTVTDMLSRELSCINDDYLDASLRMLNFLSTSNHSMKMRVTVAGFDANNNKYYPIWSEHRGGGWAAHSKASLNAEADRIPLLPPDDQLIIVETRMAYESIFKISSIGVLEMENFVVVRPRAGRLYWCEDILVL